jgi:TonB-dependent SusC/RagA subfamily outer membrane receptor
MRADVRQMLLSAGLPLVCLLAIASPPALAQQGAVGGVVTDAATKGPLEAARVILTGPNRIETTNREGRFMFRNVAPGQYPVRVLRLGYAPVTDTAVVAPSETVALEIAMTPAPVQLDEIVTTATGEQRKLEVANAVSTIDAARIAKEVPIAEFGNLISGRAAGVQVQKSGGTTGTGTRIRIRGSNSVSLSNEPLYYIDGIRMESGATSSTLDIGGFGQGVGAGPSRINDLNPDDIESIEIVKGPAAATLYGIQASNGVVKITTKRGRAGRARWNLYSELGSVADHNTYPLISPAETSTIPISIPSASFSPSWTATAPRPRSSSTRRWRIRRPSPTRRACASSTGPTCRVAPSRSRITCPATMRTSRAPIVCRSSRRTRWRACSARSPITSFARTPSSG